jgi:hypothetical protein
VSVTRLKFLKRKKLLQSDIKILLETTGKTKRFSATLALGAYDVPPNARVVVDAGQLLETIRFELGTVENLTSGVLYDISRLRGERVSFSVSVLDPTGARKLATAEAIRPNRDPSQDPGVTPLLPVDDSQDLNGPVWCVHFEAEDTTGLMDAPLLCIDNKAIGGASSTFLSDNKTRALVLPSAMRDILQRILLIDEHEYAPDADTWRDRWIRFAGRLTASDIPAPDEPVSDRLQFIDDAVGAFSRRHMLTQLFITERNR